ncbi:MAG TPA: VTT domain-containing protein [Anaerolineales bacterium]
MSSASATNGWRLRLLRIVTLVLVIGLSVFLFSIRDRATELAAYGYPGIFLISVLTNATLILPMPGVALTFAAGAIFHPLAVGIAAGLGSTLGELTGYLAGFSGQGVLERAPLYERLLGWTDRYGQWAILVLAIVPNPVFDLAGAAAGALRMPLRQFLVWAAIGKTIKMLIFAYAGAASAVWVLKLLGS